METKFLEIRDRMTFIPALAVAMSGNDHGLARLAGFGTGRYILLTALGDIETQYGPAGWRNARTMHTAHEFIIEHWDELRNGSVVDVRFILGETEAPCASEIDSKEISL